MGRGRGGQVTIKDFQKAAPSLKLGHHEVEGFSLIEETKAAKDIASESHRLRLQTYLRSRVPGASLSFSGKCAKCGGSLGEYYASKQQKCECEEYIPSGASFTNMKGKITIQVDTPPDGSKAEREICFRGFLDHEILHELYSDYPTFKAFVKDLKKLSQSKEERKAAQMKKLQNILEDGMIEEKERELNPGAFRFISACNYLWPRTGKERWTTDQDMVTKAPDGYTPKDANGKKLKVKDGKVYVPAGTELSVWGKYPLDPSSQAITALMTKCFPEHETGELSTVVKKAMGELEDAIDAAVGGNTADCVERAYEVHDVFRKYNLLQDEMTDEEREAMEQLMQGMAQMDSTGMEPGEEADSFSNDLMSGGGSSFDDLDDDDDDDGEPLEPMNGPAGSGSGKGQKSDQQGSGGGGSGGDEEGDDDGDEDGSGGSGGKEDDEKKDGKGGGSGDEDSDEKDEEDGDGKGGKGGDKDDKDDKDGDSDSDGKDGDDSDKDSDKTGDKGKDGDKSEDNASQKSDSQKGGNEASKGRDKSIALPQDVREENEKNGKGSVSKDDIEAMKKQAERDLAKDALQEKKQMESKVKKNIIPASSWKLPGGQTVKGQKELSRYDGDSRALKSDQTEIANEGRRLATILEQLKTQAARDKRNQKTGRLDKRKLASSQAGDRRIYYKKGFDLDLDMEIDISMDLSYSTQPDRPAMYKMAKMFAFAGRQAKIPTTIYGWEGSHGGTAHYAFKERFSDDFKGLDSLFQIPGGGTPTEDGIAYGRARLSRSKANFKLLPVITDGASHNPKLTREQVLLAQKEGITVLGIGVGGGVSKEDMDQQFGGGAWIKLDRYADANKLIGQIIRKEASRKMVTRGR